MNSACDAGEPGAVLARLYATLVERKTAGPGTSYVAALNAKGVDAILKKIGEETAEVLIAAKNVVPPSADDAADGTGGRAALVHELADLWFHTLVLLAAYDLPLDAVTAELARRMGRSGLEEKAARPGSESCREF